MVHGFHSKLLVYWRASKSNMEKYPAIVEEYDIPSNDYIPSFFWEKTVRKSNFSGMFPTVKIGLKVF